MHASPALAMPRPAWPASPVPAAAAVHEVTLEDMLAAREQRAQRQQAALAAHGQPLLSLTLVTPGAVKDSADLREVFWCALAQVELWCRARDWPVAACETRLLPTGPEALLAIAAPAAAIKALTVALEDAHALGRLWDLDVLGHDGRSLSRARMNLSPRRCLVCAGDAHACARSRAHPIEGLQAAIARLIEAHRHAAQ